MIKFEHVDVAGFEAALRGMRNPKNSWARSDSEYIAPGFVFADGMTDQEAMMVVCPLKKMGDADKDLARRLIRGGSPHRKFLRQIICWVDITAPFYWWKQFDTYRNGVEKDSCSTMFSLPDKPFSREDFSTDGIGITGIKQLDAVIDTLNVLRKYYLSGVGDCLPKDKRFFDEMIKILPDSYNQKRTVMMSYEAILNMVQWREGHPVHEWAEFIRFAEQLPEGWIFSEYTKHVRPAIWHGMDEAPAGKALYVLVALRDGTVCGAYMVREDEGEAFAFSACGNKFDAVAWAHYPAPPKLEG